MVGDALHESVYRLLSDQRASWVIGVGDEKLAGLGSDCRQHRLQVMRKTRIGNLNGVGSEELGHEAVNREGMACRHHFVARLQKSVANELDDFVRAIPKNDILTIEVQIFGNRVAKGPRAAIRVEVGALQSVPHGLKSGRRGAKRVFIRGELDDLRWLQTHLSGEFLHGFAWFVGDEIKDMFVGVGQDG